VLYSGIICYNTLNIISLDTLIGIYAGLFHSVSITHSFALFLCIIGAIVLLIVYYPRRSQKSMGAMGKKIYSFFLTKYSIVILEISKNQRIKMREQFRILEFPLIVLFILIGAIFLISLLGSLWVLSSFCIDPCLLCAFIPIKSYSNVESEKSKIIKDNKDKSGIYM
jgi:NADH-ubiquinone oxidoreductase chain 2